MRLILPREEITAIDHPLYLWGCLRVDHDVVDDLQLGRGDWPGDARLVLYADTKRNEWLLARLEFDGTYRLCARSPRAERLGDETFWKIVRGLQAHDTRFGYDVVADVDAHENALERDVMRRTQDELDDGADRFGFELRKAGATDYC